jgi:hypothetical protein
VTGTLVPSMTAYHRRRDQPWYTAKTEPAFEGMLTSLRRALITARISAGHPAHPTTSKSTPSSQSGKQPPHNRETPDILRIYDYCGKGISGYRLSA